MTTTPDAGGPSFEATPQELDQVLARIHVRRRRRRRGAAAIAATATTVAVAAVLSLGGAKATSSLEQVTSPSPTLSTGPTAVTLEPSASDTPRTTPSLSAPATPSTTDSGASLPSWATGDVRVFLSNGAPAEGISVASLGFGETTTGADGRAPARLCEAGATIVRSWPTGQSATVSTPNLAWEFYGNPDTCLRLELAFHLRVGGILSGTVRDSDGRPVAGEPIGAMCNTANGRDDEAGTYGTISDAQGHYRLPGLNTCVYTMVFGEGYSLGFTAHSGPTAGGVDLADLTVGQSIQHDLMFDANNRPPSPTPSPGPSPGASPTFEPSATPSPTPSR